MEHAWDDDSDEGPIVIQHDPLLAPLLHLEERLLLIQFPRARCVPSLSPYSLKMETYLRVADLPYTNISNNFHKFSRKGQIPYIELDGQQIPDTNFIIRLLAKEFVNNYPDRHLTTEEVALSKAFMALIEGRLVWVLANSRAHNNSWLASDSGLGGHFSGLKFRLFRAFGLPFYRMKARRKCYLEGIGRLTQLEVEALAKADLTALSVFLGAKKYYFGDKPTTLDCASFGVLCQFLFTPIWPDPIKRHLNEQCRNLVGHVQRMREHYWPDWEEATKNLDLTTDWKKASIIKERYSLVPCDVSSSNLANGDK